MGIIKLQHIQHHYQHQASNFSTLISSSSGWSPHPVYNRLHRRTSVGNATGTKTTLALCSVRAGGAHHSNSLHGSARTQTSSKSLISAALHHASARESSHYNIFKLQQQKTETDELCYVFLLTTTAKRRRTTASANDGRTTRPYDTAVHRAKTALGALRL